MFKKLLLLISIICTGLFCQAQRQNFTCYMEAANLLKNGNDNRVISFYDLCSDPVEGRATYYLFRGDLFFQLKNYDSASTNLEKGLTIDSVIHSESYFFKLADAYIRQEQFKEALVVLDRNDSVNKRKELFTEFNSHLNSAYRRAQCYAGLGKTKIAISTLTPYMFKDNVFGTSKDQQTEVATYYLSLLRSKYSNKKIQRNFKRAVRKMDFSFSDKPNPDDRLLKGINLECSCSVKFSIKLWRKRVLFSESGLFEKTGDTCACPGRFTKEYAINYIKTTYLYQDVFR